MEYIGNTDEEATPGRRAAEGKVLVGEILAVVDDLIFLSKIQQTARLVGVTVQPVDPKDVSARLEQSSARAVILDLNHRSGSAVEFLRAMKASPATQRIPVIAFLSHVQTDLAAAAREAGCDILLARSAFVRELPQLMERFAGAGSPRG